MTRLLTLFIFLCCCGSAIAQNEYLQNTTRCTGNTEARDAYFSYSTDLSARMYQPYMGEITLHYSFRDYNLTSITYQGVNAGPQHGFYSPMPSGLKQADITADILLTDGTTTYQLPDMRIGWVKPSGYANNTYLSAAQISGIKSRFGLRNGQDFLKLRLSIGNCRVEPSTAFSSQVYDVLDNIDSEISNKREADRLISRLNELPDDTTEGLQARAKIYEQLIDLEPGNSGQYEGQLAATKEKLADIEKEAEEERDRQEALALAEEEESRKAEAAEAEPEEEDDDRSEAATDDDEIEEEENDVAPEVREPTVEEKVAAYRNQVEETNRQNAALASQAAASNMSAFLLMAVGIYANYGNASHGRIFTPRRGNFHIGMDVGYSVSSTPTLFASNRSNIDPTTGDIYYKEETQKSHPAPLNLNLGLRMGFDVEVGSYLGLQAEAYGGGRAGMSLIMSDFHYAYHYGGRVAFGLPFVKATLGYRLGEEYYTKSKPLDSEEIGEATTQFGTESVRAGLQISWWGHERAYGRKHLTVGLLQDRFNNMAKDVLATITIDDDQYVYDRDVLPTIYDPEKLGLEKNYLNPWDDLFANIGYYLEYRHDHFGTLILDVYPSYSYTGLPGGVAEDDGVYEGGIRFHVGFLRNLDWFF